MVLLISFLEVLVNHRAFEQHRQLLLLNHLLELVNVSKTRSVAVVLVLFI